VIVSTHILEEVHEGMYARPSLSRNGPRIRWPELVMNAGTALESRSLP